ncbi:hypothetical protein B0T24DRAFT_665151 [Lasiosphaeria ovina]|uniref:Uncharacterized protein n=1 Tax=Lasiosphaeria ovina TaxID=92902 RepID=A0AAE0KH38_9PEZI|nr:hypothetical protein B0T24DRAFT_665151 [Lasiosphaeria ovina]
MAEAERIRVLFDNASESEKEAIVKHLFYRELESIRRKPLLDPASYGGAPKVAIYRRPDPENDNGGDEIGLRGGAGPRAPFPTPKSSSSFPASSLRTNTVRNDAYNHRLMRISTIVESVDSHDNKANDEISLRGGAKPTARPTRRSSRISLRMSRNSRSFDNAITDDEHDYGHMRIATVMETIGLADGSDDDDDGTTPFTSGPLTGMRIDVQAIRRNVGYKRPFEDQFPDELRASEIDFLATGYEFSSQEDMYQSPDWLPYLRSYYHETESPVLFSGFPLIEDVVFVKHPNYWYSGALHKKVIHNGQCYWTTIALLVYGNASLWLRVKAEHLAYAEQVLSNPKHPRHAFYKRENTILSGTRATGPAGSHAGAMNWWERLHVPGCWSNDDIITLTANLYCVFVVLYKYKSGPENPQWGKSVYDLRTFGAYNTRHIFLCYYVSFTRHTQDIIDQTLSDVQSENHYQPMVPNDYWAYEFKLPRLTLQSTSKYRLMTAEHQRTKNNGLAHHLRGPKDSLAPLLATPSFKREHLYRAVGYAAPSATSTEPVASVSDTPPRRPLPSARPLRAATASPSPQPASPVYNTPRKRKAPTVDPSEEDGGDNRSSAARKTTPRRSRSSQPPLVKRMRQQILATSTTSTPLSKVTPDPGNAVAYDGDNEPDTSGGAYYRLASRTALTRLRLKDLQRWCNHLPRGVVGKDVARWRKDDCISELMDARLMVRIIRDELQRPTLDVDAKAIFMKVLAPDESAAATPATAAASTPAAVSATASSYQGGSTYQEEDEQDGDGQDNNDTDSVAAPPKAPTPPTPPDHDSAPDLAESEPESEAAPPTPQAKPHRSPPPLRPWKTAASRSIETAPGRVLDTMDSYSTSSAASSGDSTHAPIIIDNAGSDSDATTSEDEAPLPKTTASAATEPRRTPPSPSTLAIAAAATSEAAAAAAIAANIPQKDAAPRHNPFMKSQNPFINNPFRQHPIPQLSPPAPQVQPSWEPPAPKLPASNEDGDEVYSSADESPLAMTAVAIPGLGNYRYNYGRKRMPADTRGRNSGRVVVPAKRRRSSGDEGGGGGGDRAAKRRRSIDVADVQGDKGRNARGESDDDDE